MSTIVTPPRMEAAGPQAESPAAPHSRRSGWQAALNAVPSLLAFALLGGVMYLGHHTGWKLPKASELWGPAAPVADDWCAEHLVPASACIECQPDLLPKPKPRGFCREHGVAECVLHYPELAQVADAPQLPRYDTLAALRVMTRPVNNSRNTMHLSRVQFASAEALAKAGIEVDVVQERPMLDAITAYGELIFDPTRVGHLSSRAPGAVAAVFKTVGDPVAAGEILALVDASQVGQAKSQLLQAMVQLQLRKSTVERLRPIASSGAVPQKSVIEAEAALQDAEVALIAAREALVNLGFQPPDAGAAESPQQLAERLRYLDIPSSLVDALPEGARTANLIPIRAPYAGVLVEAEVVAGEVVDTARTLLTVSDPRRLWLMLNVRQEDAEYVRPGLTVRFRGDQGQHEVTGQVAWVSPAVNEQTRTLQVRVAVANDDGRLRDKTFGVGKIILREEPLAVVVPREAVQSTPDASFVFVRDKRYFEEGAPKFFHVRQVRLGASDEQSVELLAGVLPGEVIATRGSNVLLAQLLRSNLGAGCGCHEQ